MWYNVNWDKLVVLLIPTFLRKPILIGYLRALVAPIKSLHYLWLRKREADWYKMQHTGQVCYLRKVLNDALDVDARRIYIGDGNAFVRDYIYTREENKPVFIGTKFIYQRNEYFSTGADFIVFVPAEIISTRIYELESLLDFYKLGGKQYQIRPI